MGVLWPAEVDRLCALEARTQFLVEDFLPVKSIAIAAGESTIGKSALICQLGLCVAAGVPFLGLPTTKGPVLYLDLENSLPSCKTMRDSLVRFLGLDGPPQDFLLKPEPQVNLEELLEVVRPKLVAIDSLRAFRPDVTEKNSTAGEWLQVIRRMSRKHDCAFLVVHHLRKSSRDTPPPDLESCSAASWLQEMEGARALAYPAALSTKPLRIAPRLVLKSQRVSAADRLSANQMFCRGCVAPRARMVSAGKQNRRCTGFPVAA